MKNKMLARRIAIAMLSAATVMTAAPVGAFAATTQQEASYATFKDGQNGTKTVTVKKVTAAGADVDTTKDDAAAQIVAAIDAVNLSSATTTDDALKLLQAKTSVTLTDGTVHSINVTATTLTGTNANGTVTVEYDDGSVYTLVYTTTVTGDMTDAEIEALDAVFEKTDAITYSGKSVNIAVVQSAFNKALGEAKDVKNTATASTFFGKADNENPAGAGNGYNYTVKSATVADGKVTGTIERVGTRTPSGEQGQPGYDAGDVGTVYSYKYSAKAVQNADTKKATVKEAISSIESNVYPQPANLTDGDDSPVLKAKIQKDLNDALDGNATANLGNGTVDLATRAANGSYNSSVDGNNVNVALKYSSDSKLADAVKLAKDTTLKDAKTADRLFSLQTKNAQNQEVNGTQFAANTSETDDDNNVTGTVQLVKKFSSTSAFSRALQPTTATKAVDKDAVKDAVLKLFTDAADTAKYTGDGVTYSAEVVKFNNDGRDTTDDTTDATIKAPGKYLIKVTASIDNDFYGWTINNAEVKNATSTASWYVEVETSKLAETKNTGISFADKTVVYTTNAYASNDTALMKVDLAAVLTPADSNSDVTYTITTNDKKNAGVIGDGTTKYYKGLDASKHHDTDTEYTSKKSELYVPGAGTYKIKATANGKSATATITVKNKFNDVTAGAYYEGAVNWAYGKGVTDGVSSDDFGTNENVTRAQYVTWLYRNAVANDSSVEIKDADLKQTFSDVPTTAYYAKAVQWASQNGVAAGTGNGKFSPDAEITRAQAITFIYRAKGQPDTKAAGGEGENTTQFTDLAKGGYYVPAVTWGVNTSYYIYGTDNGGNQVLRDSGRIISGTSTTTFSPDATATRAQAITFIWRAFM